MAGSLKKNMKIISSLLILTIICSCVSGKEAVYVGSSPAHLDVRKFLGISLTDSINFIRWKIAIGSSQYELKCQYGLSRGGTNGFVDEKKVAFSGRLTKQGNYYHLQQRNKTFYLMELNSNLLHLLDKNKTLLIGNGGYSYTLNIDVPVKTDQFNLLFKQTPVQSSMAFEGRTPCQELSRLLKLAKGPACDKLKWFIILYVDSITGRPSHYLNGGIGYRKETMAKVNGRSYEAKMGG